MQAQIIIDKSKHIPIYEQIKLQVKGLIQSGRLKTGDQLPTLRELSTVLAVNVNTVALAYRDLTSEGFITTARGKGSFVASAPTAEQARALRQEKLRGLLEALIHETDQLGYARDEVGRALVEVFRRLPENQGGANKFPR
jgi:GntR family transcriptional regulator